MNGSSRPMFHERLLAQESIRRVVDLSAARAWARRMVADMAVQDWVAIVYVAALFIAVGMATESPARTMNLERLFGLAVLLAATLLGKRGGLAGKGWFSALLYRCGMLGVILMSYFMLRGLLPVVNTGTLDAELYALDVQLFGFEPTLWMDQFVGPRTTEWFAFFYFSYFFLIAAWLLPLLFFGRRLRVFADFGFAFMSVYCVAHVLYMVVPGYGPYQHLAGEFQNPLPMGFWYERVLEAVNGAGAHKDIFPSLHTAGPFTCFLFALRYRKLHPYKYLWLPTGFFAANIIIATMFLRWHYIIDVVAGIALSAVMSYIAFRLSHWESNRRERRGLEPVWAPLWPPRSPDSLPEPRSHQRQEAPAAE